MEQLVRITDGTTAKEQVVRESEKEPQPTSLWLEERSKATWVRGQREETRRSRAIDEKEPRRAKPTAGRREEQTTGKRKAQPKAGKASQRTTTETKYEEKHSTEESYSQPVPKRLRTDADVQQEERELKLDEGITTI